MDKKASYTYNYWYLLAIRFADPVSAMAMNENFIVIGTMMGRLCYMSLAPRKSQNIRDISSENISDISYENNTFYCGIGDDEVVICPFDSTSGIGSVPANPYKNYKSDSEHNKKCENCFTMLSHSCIFQIQLSQPEEGNVTISPVDAEYVYKDIRRENTEKQGTIPMTNYSVPLDFDSERFLWVEYLSDIERRICVYSFRNGGEPYKFKLEKSFGHISHAKFLLTGNCNKIFLVRNLNICEIRALDDNFSLVSSFKHIGDEVYAIDIFYGEEKRETEDEIAPKNMSNIELENKNEELYIKIQDNHGNFGNNNNNALIHPTTANNMNSVPNVGNINGTKKDENYSICLLDIDGNINVYEDGKINTEFNLYNIKDISQDQKDKQFFSLGYSYYIKFNKEFFAISSDHGCYIIKKNIHRDSKISNIHLNN